ncbi:MAG: hypothetical protein AAF738_02235 [Bacteroidota bacterium]
MENNILDRGLLHDSPNLSFNERVQEIKEQGFSFSIGDCLKEGFRLFKKDAGGFIGFMLILILVGMLPLIISVYEPVLGTILNLAANLATGPLSIGMAIVAKKIYHNEAYSFSNFFDGFNYFIPLIISAILVGLLVTLGFLAFLIPGIYLGVAFSWVNYIIVFAGKDVTDAMGASRKVISKNWFLIFGLLIVMGFVVVAGFLTLGIGLLVAIPVISCSMYIAYEKVIGAQRT